MNLFIILLLYGYLQNNREHIYIYNVLVFKTKQAITYQKHGGKKELLIGPLHCSGDNMRAKNVKN